jgi:hypothetical protein
MIRWAKMAVVVERKDEGAFIANGASFGKNRIWHSLDVVAEPYMLYEDKIGVLVASGVNRLLTHLTRMDSLRFISGSTFSMFTKSDV